MGMAASQARLLSITARLSNNEMTQQALAYSKQRIADNTEQINDAYLEALNKTHYQIIVGYNDGKANYTDLTYNQLAGLNSVAMGKQYLIKDKSGKVLVSSKIADAFKSGNGDYNAFLKNLGYSQINEDLSNTKRAQQLVHEAWDRYLVSVGQGIDDSDSKHILGFGYSQTEKFGYPIYSTAYAVSENGLVKSNLKKDEKGDYYKEMTALDGDEETGEVSFIQDNGVKFVLPEGYTYEKRDGDDKFYFYGPNKEGTITKYTNGLFIDIDEGWVNNTDTDKSGKNYLTKTEIKGVYKSANNVKYNVTEENIPLNYEGTSTSQRELYDYAAALTEAVYNKNSDYKSLSVDTAEIGYYKNIFNEMRLRGYTTTPDENIKFKDSKWFVEQLKAGNITLSYYSLSEKEFLTTTLESDESIVEKEDLAAIAVAEQVYKNQMDELEHQDKQFDLQLGKLESEHNALQTEYESVKSVISKNVEKSFNTFEA